MPSVCQFELDHPNAVYYSGQTVSGAIKLTTTEEKSVRNVRIVFLGEGKVKWDESYTTTDSNGGSTTHTTYYRSHEVYVNNETFVHGEGELPLGLHTYTFSITLPPQCPTSCEGKYGHVRYGLSLILDRPFRFNNVYNLPLTVLQTVDLNLFPTLKLPLLAEEIGSPCCWPCSSGKLMYALRTPFGAYSPGQSVKYSLCIDNQSMVDTAGYSLEFTQKMIFTAHSPRCKQNSKKNVLLQQSSNETCLRLSNRIFEGQFRIPSVPPSNHPSCIIHIEYMLKVTVRLSGCHKSTGLAIPIFIGNIPLRESLPSTHVEETEGTKINPSAPDLDSNSDMPPSYHDLKPPSYEASMQRDSPFIDHDVDKHHRVDGFRPLYPMYS